MTDGRSPSCSTMWLLWKSSYIVCQFQATSGNVNFNILISNGAWERLGDSHCSQSSTTITFNLLSYDFCNSFSIGFVYIKEKKREERGFAKTLPIASSTTI